MTKNYNYKSIQKKWTKRWSEKKIFEAEPKKFNVIAEGDLSQAKIEIQEDDSMKIGVEGTAKIRSKYSIEYLKKMVGASKLSENVDIKFNKDYPLRLDYKEVDKLMLSFILAPRVEND